MEEKVNLTEIKEKINNEREKLDKALVEGLDKKEILELSCRLDDLINEYYQKFYNAD